MTTLSIIIFLYLQSLKTHNTNSTPHKEFSQSNYMTYYTTLTKLKKCVSRLFNNNAKLTIQF